jgi:hypothetical protein
MEGGASNPGLRTTRVPAFCLAGLLLLNTGSDRWRRASPTMVLVSVGVHPERHGVDLS